MSSALMKFINSPTGPKTTHFWGPVANWGFVLAGLEQTTKPEHMISGPMTGALTVYSGLFMRFAWRVQPRNYILLACHTANGSVQVRILRRDTTHERAFAPSPKPSQPRARLSRFFLLFRITGIQLRAVVPVEPDAGGGDRRGGGQVSDARAVGMGGGIQ